jgi:LytS/YehU family sensor histidine kinase
MQKRRKFLMFLTAGFVALTVLVAPVIADELLGVLSKVDIDAKKVTVIEKGTDKEVLITVTDNTEFVTPKGASKIDLEKVAKGVEKAQEKGRKGINVTVTHEKNVASKITVAAKKKAAPPQGRK